MQLIVLLGVLVWLPVFAKTLDGQPEDTVRLVEKTQFVGRKEMVVAAHPLAVEAGAEILRDGGSAVVRSREFLASTETSLSTFASTQMKPSP